MESIGSRQRVVIHFALYRTNHSRTNLERKTMSRINIGTHDTANMTGLMVSLV
jgi:hypothetical protein